MKKYLCLAGLFGLLLSSCIQDDSTSGSDNVSQLSLQTPFDNTYTLNQGDTLRLAPTVVQTNEQLPVAYEWEVNHQKISDQPRLEYVCKTSGTYPCRLKITNGRNIQVYEFALNVEFAYTQGVYLLAENNHHAIVTYVPSEESKKRSELDVLATNNPDISFGEPRSMAWNRTIGGRANDVLVLAAGNPSTIYQLDGYQMISIFRTSTTGKVTQIVRSSDVGTPQSMVFINKSLYSLALNSNNLVAQSAKFNNAVSYTTQLADAMTPWWRNDLFYAHADAYFDNAQGALLANGIETTAVPLQILNGTFTGDTLVGMGGVDRLRYLALITCNKATGKFYLTHLFPGYFSTDASRRIAPNVLYRVEMPSSSGIANGSVVRTAGSKNLIYYSAGNAVYAHNVLAGSAFATSPLFTVGDSSEVIADMVFSDDDNLLYVATNNAAAAMPGSLYCYDVQTNSLRWSRPNITGRIVKALYRN
ncbi:hypothetical protein JHU38_03545 [Prevotella sp. A2931]|uniref:Bacteroidetes PKD-like domain-containing protein n=1 Tax=Prevotella illustrans TaxID=2800387 RepID=A0ABS3M3V6_9BACT|nr:MULTISPECIES: PKD-like domain-containing protein [Prevotella]MBO1362858.1 hypothetical protein [Prevotella illustrans]PTL25924.1 hypothetical protein C3V39_01865 [Prevotella sp. oral taxon 820]